MNDQHIQNIFSFVSETKNAVSQLEEHIDIIRGLCSRIINWAVDIDYRHDFDREIKKTLYKCSSLSQSILDDFNYINTH